MIRDERQVFLSYARHDEEAAKQLFSDLSGPGIRVWVDFKSLRAGERWRPAIERAIKESDFFLALLSSNSVSKKGFVQKEIVHALDMLEQFPEDNIFVIPVRLDECEPSHNALKDLHWVDLFPSWEDGVAAIRASIAGTPSPDRVAAKRIDPEGSLAPDIKIYGSKKEYVQVKIILVTTGSSYDISLPVDSMVDHAIPKLVEQLRLPLEFAHQRPMEYRLVSKTQGRTLDGHLTFRQNGVQEGEILGLNVDMQGG